jgi:hypothetical protein
MSWLAFFLGLILACVGGAGLVASLDLLTTELGVLYATCGAVAVSGGVIVIAIGLLIRRVDALRRAVVQGNEARSLERQEPTVPPLLAGIEPVILGEPGAFRAHDAQASDASSVMNPEPAAPLDERGAEATPINENRTGRLPSLEALDNAPKEPASPPALVGRYSAGGANYSIFSDGSIEAETDQGAFKFGSMSEFKSYIAARKS